MERLGAGMNVECEALSVNECGQPWNAGRRSNTMDFKTPEVDNFVVVVIDTVAIMTISGAESLKSFKRGGVGVGHGACVYHGRVDFDVKLLAIFGLHGELLC